MKKTLFLILFACFAKTAICQNTEYLSIDSAVANISRQVQLFPQEKIHMHLDKPYYLSGENIFFRIFLLDALSNKPATLSRYVYVELISPIDSVVTRVKIRPEKELFFGTIPLPKDLPQGTYKIRAYTSFMQNLGDAYFYTQYIRVADPNIVAIQTQTDFNFDEDGKVGVRLRYLDLKTQLVVHPQKITLRLNQEKFIIQKPDKEGWVSVKFDLAADTGERVLYAVLDANEKVFRQYIHVPFPEGQFDISFYPEGGHLVEGAPCSVAFKAIQANGMSLDVTGDLLDSAGNVLSDIRTVHAGMGRFVFTPLPGERYHILCHDQKKRTLRFDLPEASKDAYALKTAWNRDKLWVSINMPSESKPRGLYLLVHSGGSVIYANKLDLSKQLVQFNKNSFPSGISHILLLSEDMRVVSERLVFTLNKDQGLATFQTGKKDYKKRELVEGEIQLKDELDLPLSGTFSISVTDDREVETDTSSNIMSRILLSSELRGEIESPAYYFKKDDKAATVAADLLMMTQGWNRYDIPKAMQGNFVYPKAPLELGQVFTGTVKGGLFSKPRQHAKVTMSSLRNLYFDMTETDSLGRFQFQGFEYPDSTGYFIQALTKKGGDLLELYIDQDTFPMLTPGLQHPDVPINASFLDYVTKSDLKYTSENGMRTINLDEVQVTAARYKPPKSNSIYYTSADNTLAEEAIQNSGASSARDLLYRIPGILLSGDKIRIRNASGDPLILVDDMEMDVDFLDAVSVSDIQQVDVLKNASKLAIFGSRGANGVISITTKTGDAVSAKVKYNIQVLNPLGYQKPVAFYSPKYETKEAIENTVPDLRTTIYWQPDVKTSEDGKALLDFYTADALTTYTVIIEGIGADGKLIHYCGGAAIVVK